ncbi:hypothetical protein AB0H43_35550 [Hamadaea sp. NPDC050747]|uniref:hypothetical protein n=1 Tax=Hamadaea sp. NPDC050747 TaxID=3155789 RepID=UPI0033E1E377
MLIITRLLGTSGRSRRRANTPAVDATGKAYLDLLEREVEEERDRCHAIDTRALAIVTSSGAIVALLAAIAAIMGKRQEIHLGIWSAVSVASAVTFGFASIFGLLASWPKRREVATARAFRQLMDKYWTQPEPVARSYVYDLEVRHLESLRRINSKHAKMLRYGLISQLVAVGLLIIVFAVLVFQATSA